MKFRINILIYFSFPLFLSVVVLSCQKPVQESETQATFEIPSALNSCSDIIVSGNFIESVPVTGNENIKISVRVIKTGNWNFKSEVVNGISFSGSGTLTDTGQQIITLISSGTPVLPGNTIFYSVIGATPVPYSVSVLPKDIEDEMVQATCYFKVTIDNVDYNLDVTTGGPNQMVGISGLSYTQDSADIGVGIGTIVFPTPGAGTLSFQKGHLDNNPKATEEQFKNFLLRGAYPYVSNVCTDVITHGVIFHWSDADMNSWSSWWQGGDQTGSYFKITGFTDGHDSDGLYYVQLKMRFKCKLYMYPTGAMKELTNGEMVARFIKYN